MDDTKKIVPLGIPSENASYIADKYREEIKKKVKFDIGIERNELKGHIARIIEHELEMGYFSKLKNLASGVAFRSDHVKNAIEKRLGKGIDKKVNERFHEKIDENLSCRFDDKFGNEDIKKEIEKAIDHCASGYYPDDMVYSYVDGAFGKAIDEEIDECLRGDLDLSESDGSSDGTIGCEMLRGFIHEQLCEEIFDLANDIQLSET